MAKFYDGVPLEAMVDRFVGNYLTKTGWLLSADNKESVDSSGPVPWFTYPATRVLAGLAKKHMRVFEYGAGNSSAWWGERVSEVCSVEHDRQWVDDARKQAGPANTVTYVPADAEPDAAMSAAIEAHRRASLPIYDPSVADPDVTDDTMYLAYAAELLRYPTHHFDVVVIDGRARVRCTWIAVQRLDPSGILVFDNSDREAYGDAYRLLAEAGFARIDFWGPGPINPYEWCTSIFTKTLAHFA